MENKQRVYRKLIWRERPKDLLKDFKKIIEVIVKRHEEFMLEGVPWALERMGLEDFKKLTDRLKIKKKDMSRRKRVRLFRMHTPKTSS